MDPMPDQLPEPCPADLVCSNALAGDVTALCACACVSRDWRAAASERSLWHSLHSIPTSVTDDQLLVLLHRGRSSADVKKLDLRGCTELTDEGLAAALTPLTGLTHLNVSGTDLSVAGVVAA